MRRVTGVTGGVLRRALRTARARPDDDRGAITFIVAAMLVVMIGLAALVVDRGLVADNQRQAQSAADASALAAALALSQGGAAAETAAVTAAQRYAEANFRVTPAEWGGCTAPLQTDFVPLQGMSCISHNPTTKAVRVTLPTRRLSSIFGGIFGVSTRTVTSAATAGFGGPPGGNCVLCVLDVINGQTGEIQAAGGDVTAKTIEDFNGPGNIVVTGGQVNYVNWDGSGQLRPSSSQVSAVVDPYTGVTPPTVSGTAVTPPAGTDCTPGNYVDVSNCRSFAPGLYVIVGNSGNEIRVNATGVTFFLTCSTTDAGKVTVRACKPNEAGGSFGGAGNSSVAVTMSGPTTGTYRDMAVYVDPNNAARQRWTGNGKLRVTGILYSPNSAGLDDTRGNGQIFVTGRMVVGSIQMKGRGAEKFHISVSGPVPPGPPGTKPTPPFLTQ